MSYRDGVGHKPWVDGRDSAASDFYGGESSVACLSPSTIYADSSISQIRVGTDLGSGKRTRPDGQECQNVAAREM
jgi:hypothetical protein